MNMEKDVPVSETNPAKSSKTTRDAASEKYPAWKSRLNEDPMMPVHWRRGDAGTNLALRLGIINEDQVED